MAKTFTCRALENGIHEFHLITASIDAVDCWLQSMTEIIERDGMLGNILIILPEDFLPPVRYSLREIRLWMQYHPQVFNSTRTAVILPYGKGLRNILQTFHMTLTRGKQTAVGYFFSGEYNQAIDWLSSTAERDHSLTTTRLQNSSLVE